MLDIKKFQNLKERVHPQLLKTPGFYGIFLNVFYPIFRKLNEITKNRFQILREHRKIIRLREMYFSSKLA